MQKHIEPEEIQSTLNSTSTVSWIDKKEALERESGTFPFWQPEVYHLLTLNTKKAVEHGFQSQSLTDIINEVKGSLLK